MKIGVVGIIIEKDRSMVESVQKILSSFADVILSRTGLPDREREIYVISLIVRGSNERISALSGKLGRLNSVTVKTAVTELPTSSQDE
ncbi:MAG: CopG family transcriptional regulator [Christensenellaceae bacterium]|nr:CopG family transcriptional regulator [Christensenellaceae bacterium]MDD6927395.1 CopG family transcriptional regulator [bacterium]MDY2850745.1 TM1266 family iron-only hydrogenase system putative regulator [Christensenellaceae bacterium]